MAVAALTVDRWWEQAAWDCNEYQLDVSQPADVAEYKRIIDRNAQIGIPNQVYEPRNTAVSSRFNHTDDWEWEMVLMFEMNGDFRRGTWTPGKDPLPPTVASMMDYFKSKGVRPTAYFYPILNCKCRRSLSRLLQQARLRQDAAGQFKPRAATRTRIGSTRTKASPASERASQV